MNKGQLIGTREAGQFLGFSQEWVQRNAARIGIPYIEINNRMYFTVMDLQNWLANSRSEPTSGTRNSRNRKKQYPMRVSLVKKSA